MARRRTGEPSLEDVQRVVMLLVKGSERGDERATVGELARRALRKAVIELDA